MTGTTLTIGLVALGLTACVFGAVATIAIGAYALRNIVDDTTTLFAQLPTRIVPDDSAARESNRRKSFSEVVMLLSARALPGILIALSGVGILFWVSNKIIALAGEVSKGFL